MISLNPAVMETFRCIECKSNFAPYAGTVCELCRKRMSENWEAIRAKFSDEQPNN